MAEALRAFLEREFPVIPTETRVLRLLAYAGQGETGQRDRAIVMTLLVCGIRRGELCGLRLGDVDLRERRLHVRAATSKSGEARDVTLHLEAAKELDVYINDVRSTSSSIGSRWPQALTISARTCSGTHGRRITTAPHPEAASICTGNRPSLFTRRHAPRGTSP